MRIIANAETGYLVSATKVELEKLSNTYYEDEVIKMCLGAEIPISDMYDQIKFLKQHKNSIDQAKENLQKIIDNLEIIKPFVAP